MQLWNASSVFLKHINDYPKLVDCHCLTCVTVSPVAGAARDWRFHWLTLADQGRRVLRRVDRQRAIGNRIAVANGM
jgi:hypothetical protein